MKKVTITQLLGQERNYQKFHSASKLVPNSKINQLKNEQHLKEYPRLDKVILPDFKIENFLKKKRNDLTLNNLSELFGNVHGIDDPLEIYLLSLDTELPKGIYHYNARRHLFEVLSQKKMDIERMFKFSSKAKLVIFISAFFIPTIEMYNERGYRVLLKKVGQLTQKILTRGQSININLQEVEFFYDDICNNILGIDDLSETILQVLVVETKQ